jgi:hypothetical protein
MGIALNLYIAFFSNTVIFTILILPIHEHGCFPAQQRKQQNEETAYRMGENICYLFV